MTISISPATPDDIPTVFKMTSDMAVQLNEEKVPCVRWYVLKDNQSAVALYKKYDVSFEENRFRCNYFVEV